MPQYMLLCYQEDPDPAQQRGWEAELPVMVELHQQLKASGVLVGVGRLHSVDSATCVRVRGGESEIVDGPFAITKERLAGYYLIECPDLDAALKVAAGIPHACHGTLEVRPVMAPGEWVERARDAGAELGLEAAQYLR